MPRHLVAQPIRHRQDPLPHPHQATREGGGPPPPRPPPPAGPPPPPFERDGQEVPAPAPLPPNPPPAVLEHAARQELPELPLHGLRQARAVARLGHRRQEG